MNRLLFDIADVITDADTYSAYMNLLQGGYNVLVGLVVLLGLGMLSVLILIYMPRNSLLSAKDETIRQLREQLSKLSERAASDAITDLQERTEIVADREEREYKLIEKYEKQADVERKERDLWRHRSNFADQRAKLYAQYYDELKKRAGCPDAQDARIKGIEDKIRKLDEEIRKIRSAA